MTIDLLLLFFAYITGILVLSPMLRCVANDMNRWEIFPSLLIGTSIFKMAAAVSLLLLQIGLFWQHKWCSMGENAFHMVFQERWDFSHSSPNPALAATRLWAGYGELVGENSISPGKPCEMHIFRALFGHYLFCMDNLWVNSWYVGQKVLRV